MAKNNLINFFLIFFVFIFIWPMFIQDSVGGLSLLIIFYLTFILARFYPSIGHILIFAFLIRIIMIYLGSIFILPDSSKDAVMFEKKAFEWSQGGFLNLLSIYSGPSSKFISWVIAIFYSLFGRSLLMAQSLSLFFGMGSIFFGWLLAKKLWNDNTATKVCWVLALFPTLILYSILIMREVYCTFFLLIAIYGIINWTRSSSFFSFALAIFGFVGATFFHGAMIIGAIFFLMIVWVRYYRKLLQLIMIKKINLNIILTFILISFLFGAYLSNNITFPKIGSFNNLINLENLFEREQNVNKGGAAYPEFLKIEKNLEFLYKVPVKTIYFLISPLPWDIKQLNHLFGVLDSFLYMILIYYIFQNRKVIWKDPTLRIILLLIFFYILIFGIGVGNFGTSLRHRSKFVIGLILLAAPYIPKISFFLKAKSS